MSSFDGRAVAAAGRAHHFLARQAAAEAEAKAEAEEAPPRGQAARAAAAALRAQILSGRAAEPRSRLSGYTPHPIAPLSSRSSRAVAAPEEGEGADESQPQQTAATLRPRAHISKAERRRRRRQAAKGCAEGERQPDEFVKEGERRKRPDAPGEPEGGDEDLFSGALPLIRPTEEPAQTALARSAKRARRAHDSGASLDDIFGQRKPTTFTAADGSVFRDMRLVCRDCGNEFVFAAAKQAALAERGWHGTKTRCEPCAKFKKCRFGARLEDGGDGRGAAGRACASKGRGRAAGGRGGGRGAAGGRGPKGGKGGAHGGRGSRRTERPGTVTF